MHTARKMMNDAVVTEKKLLQRPKYRCGGSFCVSSHGSDERTVILQFRVGGPKVEGRGCNPAVSNPGWSDRDKGGEAGRTKAGIL